MSGQFPRMSQYNSLVNENDYSDPYATLTWNSAQHKPVSGTLKKDDLQVSYVTAQTDRLGTGSATKEKPSKWILEDILSFMDTEIYERQSVTNVSHEIDTIEGDYISSHDNSVITQMEPEIENVS
ncbi:hypothetical protein QTP88_003650 [Uroleucon formosanum]